MTNNPNVENAYEEMELDDLPVGHPYAVTRDAENAENAKNNIEKRKEFVQLLMETSRHAGGRCTCWEGCLEFARLCGRYKVPIDPYFYFPDGDISTFDESEGGRRGIEAFEFMRTLWRFQAWQSGNLLSGFLEVPDCIAELLYDGGWKERLNVSDVTVQRSEPWEETVNAFLLEVAAIAFPDEYFDWLMEKETDSAGK